MVIGKQLLKIRESKNLTQLQIEQRSGLLRCYVSRVENGHTVPSVAVLERLAKALEIPMYQLFHDGDQPVEAPKLPKRSDEILWGTAPSQKAKLVNLCQSLARMSPKRLRLLMSLAIRLANIHHRARAGTRKG
jgi:transcriptional regulator with XRE-family HTH domain